MFDDWKDWIKVLVPRRECGAAARHLHRMGFVQYIPQFRKGDYLIVQSDLGHAIAFQDKDVALLFKLSWQNPD